MLPDQFNKLEIIDSIQKDVTGEVFKETSETLHLKRNELKRELDSGVTPDEYTRISTLIAAYDAAAEVLPSLWERAAQDKGPA